MHRKLVVVAIIGLFAALIVPAAFAAQPTIQRIPLDVHFVADSCGFPVQVDATGTVVDISYTDAPEPRSTCALNSRELTPTPPGTRRLEGPLRRAFPSGTVEARVARQ